MKVRRVDFSPDEWIGGCVGLDNAERGLYITACALIYSKGGPIEYEHLRAACRDHGHAFRRQYQRLIDLGKLTVNGSQIDNKRCANEIQAAAKRSEKGSKNAAERWKNNGVSENLALQPSNARARVSINHQPSEEKETTASAVAKKDAGDRPGEPAFAWYYDPTALRLPTNEKFRWRILDETGNPESVPRVWLGETYQSHPLVDGYRAMETFGRYYTEGNGSNVMRTERGWHQAWHNWIAKERNGPDTSWVDRYGFDKFLHGYLPKRYAPLRAQEPQNTP